MALRSVQSIPIPETEVPVLRDGYMPPGSSVVGISYTRQTEDNWCWAACAEMIFQHFGFGARTQCSIATTVFDLACCPSPGAPSPCDKGAWPDVVYPRLELPTRFHDSAFSSSKLKEELATGRPVQVCYQWSGSRSTHVALIVGENSRGHFVVYDPHEDHGIKYVDHSQILSAYGGGAWVYTFTF